jgi:hypothetical protein
MQGVLKIAGTMGVSLHDLTAGPPSVLEMSGMAGEASDRVALFKKAWNETAADIACGTRHEHLLDRGHRAILSRLLRVD